MMASPTEEPDSALSRMPRQRLYEQIVQQLLRHVETRGLAPGDRLPPERDLAATLGVSRASISQALVALEVLGVVSVRHGDGAMLLDRRSEHQVLTALRSHQARLPEVIDARAAMEGTLARLAAVRRTDADLAAIDAALDKMEADIDAGARGVDGDKAFHAAITAAGHSPLLARLMAEISELIRETRLESLAQPGRPRESLAAHRRITEAIRAGDADGARVAMEDHIALVSDVALNREHDPGPHPEED
ncbi:FadR/GntR family transcriptional regulator [Ornithinicoccus hortensis]|uniref:GntR family transcriptional regulator n=2 Tax=Ornithinicoccus hortensis TaxID=82346 RepID=A0A542YV98_9MICO|nr:GntR family transcriptional regulator [Ornithinicoccus hortensis]